MSNIVLRTKSQKLNSEAISAIKTILGLSKVVACNCVWNAWCNPNGVSEEMGLNLSETEAQIFANELRYQYELAHPYETHNGKVLLKIAKKTNNVVAHEIRGKIVEYSYYDITNIRRAGYLLRSDLEKSYFGGLRELGFSKLEAEKLKPFHCLISELFDEIMTEKYPEYTQEEEKEPAKTYKAEVSSKANASVSVIEKVPEVKQATDNSLTAEVIISNKQIIEEYYRITEELDKVGIATSELENRKKAVKELIAVSKLFR